jgi:HSP20 family protein
MSNMVRWDPFREVMGLRRAMDRLFDDALVSSSNEWQPVAWHLALDVIENDNEYVVKASVPGLKPEDLDITYDNKVLVIKGEMKEEKDIEEGSYQLRERRYGSFSRSLTLPSNVKADQIQASYTDGVLRLQLPKAEESKPKRIAIQTDDVKMIDSTAADIKNRN